MASRTRGAAQSIYTDQREAAPGAVRRAAGSVAPALISLFVGPLVTAGPCHSAWPPEFGC